VHMSWTMLEKKKRSQRDKMDRRENRNLLTKWSKLSHTVSKEGSGVRWFDWSLAFSTDFNKAPIHSTDFQQSHPSRAIMLFLFDWYWHFLPISMKPIHSTDFNGAIHLVL
jgi:hypothetical protein